MTLGNDYTPIVGKAAMCDVCVCAIEWTDIQSGSDMMFKSTL